MGSHNNATIKPKIVVAETLHTQVGLGKHTTSKHKHFVKDVNDANICWAHVQDFIRGQEECDDVQCCFIKHHIRKNAEGSLKSPRWYSFNKCTRYILILNPTTLVTLLVSYFNNFPSHLPSNFKPPTHCHSFSCPTHLLQVPLSNWARK